MKLCSLDLSAFVYILFRSISCYPSWWFISSINSGLPLPTVSCFISYFDLDFSFTILCFAIKLHIIIIRNTAGALRHACGRKGLNKLFKNITHEMYKKHWWYGCTWQNYKISIIQQYLAEVYSVQCAEKNYGRYI